MCLVCLGRALSDKAVSAKKDISRVWNRKKDCEAVKTTAQDVCSDSSTTSNNQRGCQSQEPDFCSKCVLPTLTSQYCFLSLQIWSAAEHLKILKQSDPPRFHMAKLRGIATHLCVLSWRLTGFPYFTYLIMGLPLDRTFAIVSQFLLDLSSFFLIIFSLI